IGEPDFPVPTTSSRLAPFARCWSPRTSSSSRARSSPFSRTEPEREPMSFDPLLVELAARWRAALKMGSEKRLAERAAAGILNARQRIEYLLDAGSFRELGLLATAIRLTESPKSNVASRPAASMRCATAFPAFDDLAEAATALAALALRLRFLARPR